MSAGDIGVASVILILLLIYLGLYVPVALGIVSFIGVWIARDNLDVAISLLAQAASNTVAQDIFGVIPLFVFMGLLVSNAGLGKDIYDVANQAFRSIRGGLGIATVAANAVFAAVTGVSIASASVFTRISVPEMRRHGYTARFAVGVVAGSSVLGMLIPPSVMLILYAVITEQSIGALFLAGVMPGILLSFAYALFIVFAAFMMPNFVGRHTTGGGGDRLSGAQFALKLGPILLMIGLVLGGIYAGWFTPNEAGAVGAGIALVIALAKRTLDWHKLWALLKETGHITASILLLIIAASMYSRMLGVTGLPNVLGDWVAGLDIGFVGIMALYVVILILMGTVLDTVSIILIIVPLFLTVLEPMGVDLVWFGIVTVVGAEIGLLTPPLGIACFVIKSTLDDKSISLFDIFAGAFPFAVIMLIVLVLLIAFPEISLFLV